MIFIFEVFLMGVFFEKAQRLGKSFMLPIAVLPAAGLFLGIGGALSNPNTLVAYPFLNVPWLQAIFSVMSSAGSIVFANLPVIFAIGVAVGLARSDKGTAGLAALLGFLVMNATINSLLQITGKLAKPDQLASVGQGMVLGIQSLETGVFGGVVVGILTYLLHDRFNKVQLPQFLGFFGGSRFIPIVTSFASIFLGILMFIVWPFIQQGIFHMGGLVQATGYIGTLIYGFVLRLLGPFGLHHIFYLPFWTTGLGGSEIVNGQLVEGTQKIFFAQLADPNVDKFYIGTARFMSGRFITMMFGLIGAALAIYHTAKPENKKKVFGLMLSAALTSFLTGITEPIEFAFLFVAPFLYVIHAFFDGLAFMLAHVFQITIGQTFSGGFIDFVLFGILQGNDKTNWIYVPIIGAIWFFLYYFSFRFFITRFNLKTPGREEGNEVDSQAPISTSSSSRAGLIIEGLGGAENIRDVDCCATRLRVTVHDSNKVSEETLKQTDPRGVVIRGNGVQVIYGPQVTIIKNEVEELLGES
ncbi:PTS family glucose porter, IICBA component [Desmospora sp. 8437]|nr:PTS family glucose porter, IICBA component [Desmospora sp. 8437]